VRFAGPFSYVAVTSKNLCFKKSCRDDS